MASISPVDSTELEAKAQSYPDWDDDPENPLNWPAWRKSVQLGMICTVSFLA